MRPYLQRDHHRLQISQPRSQRLSRGLYPKFLDDFSVLSQAAALAPFISQVDPHCQFHLPALGLQRFSPRLLFAILLHGLAPFVICKCTLGVLPLSSVLLLRGNQPSHSICFTGLLTSGVGGVYVTSQARIALALSKPRAPRRHIFPD